MKTWLGIPNPLGRGELGATTRQHGLHPITYHVWVWCEGHQFSEPLWEDGWLSHLPGDHAQATVFGYVVLVM